MNENTLLPGNRNYSHKFRKMPIKHPHCGRFVTPITGSICYPLNIKYISRYIENFHQYIEAYFKNGVLQDKKQKNYDIVVAKMNGIINSILHTSTVQDAQDDW